MKTIYKVGIGIAIAGASYVAYRKLSGRMVSKKGISFLTVLEGSKKKMYKDSKGLPTIGVGHLIKPNEKDLLTKTLTDAQVKKLFDKDLDRFEKVVKDTIKVPLKPHQKDALVAIAFNIGETGFRTSSLAKSINNKADTNTIIKNFSKWDSPSVLVERRAKEARLFLTGNYSNVLPESDLKKYYKS